MTPTETADILRQFNEWRRGDEDIPQFDPREIGEAIDAAVNELIDRIEVAEKERDALRAKIEAMEKQEPYAFAVNFPDSSRVELVHDLDDLCDDMTNEAHEVRKLYLAPGAQPAPSAPEDVMRDARRYLWLRNAALDWYVGPEYATYNDVVCSGEYCNYAGGGVALDSAIDALLAAAPEVKPRRFFETCLEDLRPSA